MKNILCTNFLEKESKETEIDLLDKKLNVNIKLDIEELKKLNFAELESQLYGKFKEAMGSTLEKVAEEQDFKKYTCKQCGEEMRIINREKKR